MATSELFTAANLGHLLGKAVDADKAAMAEQIVWGWLSGPLSITERPDPVTPQVFSWALELGAIAYENPAGLSSKQLGTSQQAFSSERRTEILETAAGSTPASALRPRGKFPPPRCYPDAAR